MVDKLQAFSALTTRQKVTIGVFVLIVLILIWQVFKMFGGESSEPAPAPAPTAAKAPSAQAKPGAPGTPAGAPQAPGTPQQVQLIKPAEMTAREQELMKLQQETQAKYVAAITELQMLKVAREIAETDQAIMNAKLSSVTSQKKIVDMLSPPPPVQTQQAYSSTLVTPIQAGVQRGAAAGYEEDVKYVVISVSQLRYRWSAVLGARGVLYNVHVGDVLPTDGSRVVSIDRTGVVLQKNGVRRKISLVPII